MTKQVTLPNPDTVAMNILSLTAISGELPATQLVRIDGGESYKQRVVTKLKKQGLLLTYYRDGLRSYRLTSKAKQLLIEQNGCRFGFALSGYSETNRRRHDELHRLRLHRIAEATVTMNNTGVSIYRDEKPDLFTADFEAGDVTEITYPAFYNSREIKEMGTALVKIKGGRAVGVLLTKNDVFITYNLGDSLMRWEYKSEMRTRALMRSTLTVDRLPHQYAPEDIHGLILANNMDLCYDILLGAGGKQYFVLDGNYDNFYYLTNDHKGERILAMLCSRTLNKELEDLLKRDMYEPEPSLGFEHDAFEEDDTPVLFGYFCDLPRIKRFDTAMNLKNMKGKIICFDFQKPTLAKYCGDNITIQAIDFNKWERRFFED